MVVDPPARGPMRSEFFEVFDDFAVASAMFPQYDLDYREALGPEVEGDHLVMVIPAKSRTAALYAYPTPLRIDHGQLLARRTENQRDRAELEAVLASQQDWSSEGDARGEPGQGAP